MTIKYGTESDIRRDLAEKGSDQAWLDVLELRAFCEDTDEDILAYEKVLLHPFRGPSVIEDAQPSDGSLTGARIPKSWENWTSYFRTYLKGIPANFYAAAFDMAVDAAVNAKFLVHRVGRAGSGGGGVMRSRGHRSGTRGSEPAALALPAQPDRQARRGQLELASSRARVDRCAGQRRSHSRAAHSHWMTCCPSARQWAGANAEHAQASPRTPSEGARLLVEAAMAILRAPPSEETREDRAVRSCSASRPSLKNHRSSTVSTTLRRDAVQAGLTEIAAPPPPGRGQAGTARPGSRKLSPTSASPMRRLPALWSEPLPVLVEQRCRQPTPVNTWLTWS